MAYNKCYVIVYSCYCLMSCLLGDRDIKQAVLILTKQEWRQETKGKETNETVLTGAMTDMFREGTENKEINSFSKNCSFLRQRSLATILVICDPTHRPCMIDGGWTSVSGWAHQIISSRNLDLKFFIHSVVWDGQLSQGCSVLCGKAVSAQRNRKSLSTEKSKIEIQREKEMREVSLKKLKHLLRNKRSGVQMVFQHLVQDQTMAWIAPCPWVFRGTPISL